MKVFGKLFIEVIKNHVLTGTADTYKKTLLLHREGKSVEEIALKRKLHETTIYSHIAKLYEEDKIESLDAYISKSQIAQIKEAAKVLDNADKLKPYFEYFEKQTPYHIIRLGLTVLKK